MASLKQFLKWVFKAVDIDVKRRSTVSNPSYQLLRGLRKFNINLVLDVGANTGQFASGLRSFGFEEKIVSFEPLSDAFNSLSRRALSDPNWQVHARGAVGDFDGEIEINISGNSVSSSVLPMEEAHLSAASNSAYVGSENVPICKLDSIATDYISNSTCCFLKMDVQGFEWQVLDGAKDTLKQVQGVLCEMSLVELYKNQKLWLDLIKRFELEIKQHLFCNFQFIPSG